MFDIDAGAGPQRRVASAKGNLRSPERTETREVYKTDVFIRGELAARVVNAVVSDLTTVSVEALAAAFGNVESTVFSAGTEGDGMEVTRAIGAVAGNVIEATRRADNRS